MIFDDMIGFFSPAAKLDRIRSRNTIKRLEGAKARAYDGATKGRRAEGWKSNSLSSNAEIALAMEQLRNRARELVRNNPFAARGVQVIPHNVIGGGIRLAIDHKNEKIEETVKQAWRDWAETTDCDYDGIHDIYGLQQLVMRSIVESGEVLVRRRRVRASDSSIGIKLQVLESDFLTNRIPSTTKANGNNIIIQGVEFNSRGERVAYHLSKAHPGNSGIDNSSQIYGAGSRLTRIPASEITHIYRVDRPGQVRGVTWLAPVMLRLKDYDDYEQAQLMRQKLAASYMAFIKDIEMPDPDDTTEIELLSKFEPGAIEYLPPGKDIVLSSPPEVSENYAEYARVMLQSIATGLGVSYEALTGNLRDVNFSSARMGWLEFQRNIDVWRKTLMLNGFNKPIWNWFTEASELMGTPAAEVKTSYIAPRREMIDPTKEIPALIKAVDANMKTLSEVIRENGKNPEDHFEELKAEKDMLDKLGLTVETKNNPNATDSKPVKRFSSEDQNELNGATPN